MDALGLDLLYELLDKANEQQLTLRVRFEDDEEYDLSGFFIAQDDDEEFPHCSSTLVRIVEAPALKQKFFQPDSGMFFHLNEVVSVKNISDKVLLFQRDNKTNG